MSLFALYAVAVAGAALAAQHGQQEAYQLRTRNAGAFYDGGRWFGGGLTLEAWEAKQFGRMAPLLVASTIASAVALWALGLPALSPIPLLLLPALLPWLDAWRERKAWHALRCMPRSPSPPFKFTRRTA